MNTTLRIGYVVRMFPRFSETFVLQEILELERQGVEVTIFSLNKPNEGRFHPGLARLCAPIYYLDDRDAKKWWTWLPDEWSHFGTEHSALWKVIDEATQKRDSGEIDTVFYAAILGAKCRTLGLHGLHAHFATTACSLAYYAHRIAGIPYSFTAHAKDIFSDSVDRNFLTAKINAARFAVTVTEFNRRFLVEQHPDADASRIRVLYNGVDLNFFAPGESVSKVDPPVILAVGRLVAKKGFADLVRACSLLKTECIPFRCEIVGQGREESPLRALAEELHVEDRIEFAGARHQEDVRDAMRTASVLCQPCLRDNDGNQDALPTVLLEAMATGLPVVSTRLSGVPEIIDTEVNGLLVDPGQPAQLAKALARIIADRSLARQFAVSARDKVTGQFNIRRNVSTLCQWLTEGDVVPTTPKQRRSGVEEESR